MPQEIVTAKELKPAFDISDEDLNLLLERVTTAIEKIAVGEVSIDYKSQLKKEERLADAIKRLTENLKSIIKQALSIANGNFATELTVLGPKDELGASLVEMTKMLREMDSINKVSNWVKTGQAELGNIMKGEQDIYSLAKKIIGYLCKYLGALIGTLYIVQEEDEGKKKLKMAGTYAHDRRRAEGLDINFGEGLVGQAALEKEIIIFSDVPEDYIKINSSIGNIAPKSIVVIPVMVDNYVYGVLELGSHKIFPDSQIEFLRQISNNIAQSLKTTQDHERIKRLLEESNAQTLKLRSQQEKLRLTNNELAMQKEKLQKSNHELEQKAIELKISEDAIEKSKKEIEKKATELEISSKYKSEFLANMSHELRTPLNSILILSENLIENEENNLKEDQIEDLKIIHGGGKDLLNLINDILDLSKVEAGKLTINMESVNLKTLLLRLRKQFDPIAKKKSLSFITSFDENLWPSISTDGQRIEQILKNFLSNAFKFTKTGEVALKFYLPKNKEETIAIAVKDTGIGIKKDRLEMIFEAFQQVDGSTSRKFGGTGLGLSIARQLACLLKGSIEVKSEEGMGSEFILYMPYDKAKVEVEDENDFAIDKTKTLETCLENLNKKILIVEDDEIFASSLKQKIDNKDTISKIAKTAIEALQLVREERFNAIILDLALPDMSGFSFLEKLEEEMPKTIPAIFINTAKDLTKDERKRLSKYALSFIIKGSNSDDRLLSELQLFLNKNHKEIKSSNSEHCPSLFQKKILLVDDDMRNTYALSAVLKKKGLNITMADNGKLALEKLAGEKNFDLIIMDIMMPVMDGYEAITKIRANPLHKHIPIIALTAKVLPEDKTKALACGANDFLTKPIEMHKLISLMNTWIA